MKKLAVVALSAAILFSGCVFDKKEGPDKLLKDGEFEAASLEYIRILEENEKNSGAYEGLADAYVGMNEYEAAVDTLCEGYGITGKKELVEKMNTITGKIYKTASDKIEWQTVIYCCERILECGEDAKIYEMIALCHISMEQYDKAVQTVMEGVEATEDTGMVKKVGSELYTLGSKAYSDGRTEDAKRLFEYIQEIDPENQKATDMINVINGAVKDEEEEKTEVEEFSEEPEQIVQVEPEVTEVTAPSAPTGNYVVQIGVYGELENAEKKVASANAMGLPASYFVSGGKYHVTIGTYSTESEANAAVSRAVAAGFSAVII